MNLLRKIISATASVLLLSCNSIPNQNKNEPKQPISDYPEIIDSLGLNQLYDSTKWHLYLFETLDTPKYYNELEERENLFDSNVSYANFELRFDSVYVDDTGCVKLYFEFYINDTQSVNPWDFRGLVQYANGLMFDLEYNDSEKTYICYLYKYGYDGISRFCEYGISKTFIDTTSNRWYNPLQPDVIEYLNKHKNEIHPWLYREGVKRGVIKE